MKDPTAQDQGYYMPMKLFPIVTHLLALIDYGEPDDRKGKAP